MQTLLKTHFGYDTFRPLQEDIITNVLNNQDTFVLMPTGWGKSLCFQLPALKFEWITLVISPLIALQKDQVDSLKENWINAEFINSSLSNNEIDIIQENAMVWKVKILYIAPERLSVWSFLDFLKEIKISLIAIDEAHCISEWWHDFRPDYRNLKLLKNNFPWVPLIALTATATKKVREDIVSQLKLEKSKTFISSFDRENLNISVIRKQKAYDKLLKLLEEVRWESVIIYCFSRKDTEQIAASLELDWYSAKPYHWWLSSGVRSKTQDFFIKDKINIIVATIAFWMWIDKPDIRLVVHYSFPKTLEWYYQEIWRAWRDWLPSKCVMLYSYWDRIKHDFFINQTWDMKEKQYAEEKLAQIIDYCEIQTCKRKYLLKYFWEDLKKDECGNCNCCLTEKSTFDATQITQKILSAIIKTWERFWLNYVIDVLKWSKSAQVLQNNAQNLSVYWIVDDFSKDELRQIIRFLIQLDYIKKSDGQYPTLSASKKGTYFIKNKESIKLIKPKLDEDDVIKQKWKTKISDLDYNKELFEVLRVLRKKMAEERSVPPFVIFSDVSLQEMAFYIPQDKESFSMITWVWSQKLNDLWPSFIDLLINFAKEKWLESKEISRKKKPESKIKKVKSDLSRYGVTREMLNEKCSIEEIAKKQWFKPDTIINHIDKLLESKLSLDIEYLKPEKQIFDKISDAFEKCWFDSFGKIYRYLWEKISYKEIKLARLFLG